MRFGIRTRALVLFALLGIVPVAATIGVLLPDYARAVRESEDQLQLATVAEVAGALERRWVGAEEDADAVASAVSHAALLPDGDAGEALIRSALSTRRRIDVARLEIPAAKVDMVLAKEGAAVDTVPRSDEALRTRAKEQQVAYRSVDAIRGALVVPVPTSAPGAADGWVTVPMYLGPLEEQARATLEQRNFDAKTRLVVIDADRQVVAAVGEGLPGRGEVATSLPIWKVLSSTPQASRVWIKTEFEADEGAMVGALQGIPSLGWTVALWRPREVAMAGYTTARRTALGVGLGALLLAALLGIASSRTVTRPILRLVGEAQTIGKRDWARIGKPAGRNDELGDLDRAIHVMANDLQAGEEELERETKLRADLSRFVSHEVVDGIVAGDLSLELGGHRRPITVLFADMVAFSAAAESSPPEEVVAMLNELFTVLTEVTFRHGGTVDKFIGDCLMAVWGAPVADEDHAAKALEAAEDMMRFLDAGRAEWREKYGVEMRLAIGINSGEAIVGNVGSRERMEYTVVGDVVNVAARLEAIAAPNQVLLTEATSLEAGDGFEVRFLGERKLTGRSEDVRVHELVM